MDGIGVESTGLESKGLTNGENMIKQAKIKIEGKKELLFHAFKEEVLSQPKVKQGSTGNNPQEWKNTVLMDDKRRLYLPAPYLYAPIKEAGRYSKIGRGNIVKYITASLEVSPDKIFLEGLIVPEDDKLTRDPAKDVFLDVRSVVNPMTKGRNLRYRIACKKGWKCEFIISWDTNILSEESMKKVLTDSGNLCGTGDGRGIGFGRYNVLEFKSLS